MLQWNKTPVFPMLDIFPLQKHFSCKKDALVVGRAGQMFTYRPRLWYTGDACLSSLRSDPEASAQHCPMFCTPQHEGAYGVTEQISYHQAPLWLWFEEETCRTQWPWPRDLLSHCFSHNFHAGFPNVADFCPECMFGEFSILDLQSLWRIWLTNHQDS